MIKRFISAALAAFLLFPLLGLAVFAAGPEDMAGIGITELSDTDTDSLFDFGDLSGLLALFILMSMLGLGEAAEESPARSANPALPPGTGTVIDFNTDPCGRLFYTIKTPCEHVFYLVIDTNSTTNNVYFLNAVTIDDLLPLAVRPLPPQNNGTLNPPPNTPGGTQPGEAPPLREQSQGGGNMGTIILIVAVAVVGGGAGWYIKVYRPKQQGASSISEYDPSLDEEWGEGVDEDIEDIGEDITWDKDEENEDGA
jgi:hypothetical protein